MQLQYGFFLNFILSNLNYSQCCLYIPIFDAIELFSLELALLPFLLYVQVKFHI